MNEIVYVFRKCSVCHRKLQQNQLTETEMKTLRELYRTKFMPKFISDEKVKIFEDFIQEHGPFDVFIDGLNLHYFGGNFVQEPAKKVWIKNNNKDHVSLCHSTSYICACVFV